MQVKSTPTLVKERLHVEIDERRSVRWSENLGASIKCELGEFHGRIIEVSNRGFTLFCDDKNLHLEPKRALKIYLQIGVVDPFEVACMVESVSEMTLGKNHGVCVALTYSHKDIPRHLSPQRESQRIETRQYFAPTAVCCDPLFFRENLFFQIQNCSSKGMTLLTSARNKSFIPGITLELDVNIPTSKTFRVTGRVRHVDSLDEKNKIVGVEFGGDCAQGFLSAMSEYFFAVGSSSLEQLRKAGFPVTHTDKGLTFYSTNSPQDWDALLQLRLKAYHGSGKMKEVSEATEMFDRFDPFSRQIVCRVQGEIVACGRIVFTEGDQNRSEHHSLNVPMPDFLSQAKYCEISRVCTDPRFRASDLLMNLLMQVGRIAFESGYEFAVANCNPNTWEMYRHIGWKRWGKPFSAFGRDDCQLIILDLAKCMQGTAGASLTGWNQIVFPVASYLAERGHGNIASRLRLAIHGSLYSPVKRFRVYRKLQKTKKTLNGNGARK